MSATKLTDRLIGSLQREAKRTAKVIIQWDGELKGFGARFSPDGVQVSWLFQYWIGGKTGKAKRVSFGRLSHMDLNTARIEAERLKGEVAASRLKPDAPVIDLPSVRKQKRIKEREALQGAKLGESVDLYLRRKSKRKHRSKSGNYVHQVERILKGTTWTDGTKRTKGVVDKLGKDTPVASITKADIRHLIDAKQDAGSDGMARYVFAVLRPFFAWCVERDYIATSPVVGLSNPPPLAKRKRWFKEDYEIRAFWRATLAMGEAEREGVRRPKAIFGPYYRVLLLTAQRREEVGGMGWSELDLEKAIWTIPDARTKNGKEHTVHLSRQALEALSEIERIDGSPYVFTTNGETSISGYSKAKDRLDSLMEAELADKPLLPWRVHDLRRTAASGMAKLGIPPHIIERVLNHLSDEQGGLREVYQQHEYLEERKRAIEAWGAYVEALIADQPLADNVVPMRA